LLVGGESATSYGDLLGEIGATYVAGLQEFYPVLDRLQRSRCAARIDGCDSRACG
jgi:hypothetical protein